MLSSVAFQMSLHPLSEFLYIILQDMLLCSWLFYKCECMCMHTLIWSSEVNVKCLPHLLSTLVFERSFAEPGVQKFALSGSTEFPRALLSPLLPNWITGKIAVPSSGDQTWLFMFVQQVLYQLSQPQISDLTSLSQPNNFEISPICGHWGFAPLKC